MKIDNGDKTQVNERQREVQLILNIIQPDPDGQPLFISDSTCFNNATWQNVAEIEARLRFYFKGDLVAPLTTPIWQFIDKVKLRYPGWPDN
jgi:hypothetical protein